MEFIQRIIEGDIRAIVSLGLVVTIFYFLTQRVREIPASYTRLFVRLRNVGLVVLIIAFFIEPETIIGLFNGAVDLVVGFINRLSPQSYAHEPIVN